MKYTNYNRNYVEEVNKIIENSLKKPTHHEQEDIIKERERYDYLVDVDITEYDPALKWEVLKTRIVEFSIKFSIEKAKSRKQEVKELTEKLHKLEKKLNMINVKSEHVVKYIQQINLKIDRFKKELEEALSYAAKGAMLRSKVNWFVQGEHNYKYFLTLEQSRSKNKQMSATKRHDGVVTKNRKEILEQQVQFYEKLYQSDQAVKFEQKIPPVTKLNNAQMLELGKDITVSEIGVAIARMPRYRTPGADGLPADFYKVFFVKIKQLLSDVYKDALRQKKLHISARRGVITLLPKKDRDILLIKNWRPITLLNCDYKIISKVISHRIQTVLESIIDPDQAGFIKNRNISQNIRRALDILDYTFRKNIAAVLISVDFEKAFDRVEYFSLFKAFEYFSFGRQILNWIQVLFTEMQLCTVNAGCISRWFTPTRGLFQGNPIGPFAFVTLIELLAINLRANPKDRRDQDWTS